MYTSKALFLRNDTRRFTIQSIIPFKGSGTAVIRFWIPLGIHVKLKQNPSAILTQYLSNSGRKYKPLTDKIFIMKTMKKLGHGVSHFFRSKRTQALLFSCLFILVAYGQAADTQSGSVADNLNKGFEEVSSTFEDIFDYVTYAMWTAAAAVAVLGGFSVFSKFSNGEQDAKKSLMGLIFGIILLAVTPVVVRAVFFK